MAGFDEAFAALTGHPAPLPWQVRLYENWFSCGKFPTTCSLPTGLGKTSVVAIWLIALANKAPVPRRLVYVVNRRTVVDQTTTEVMNYRSNAEKLRLDDPLRLVVDQLGISTLRGQFADKRKWSEDPSRPAVICGTVDMIGSRLLFSGYGVGFKSKPLHAGFLGQDALLVHDEAHLEPAFQCLIQAIEAEQNQSEVQRGRTELPWLPNLRVMQLTATTRANAACPKHHGDEKQQPFELTDEESNPPDVLPNPPTEPIHHVWRRLKASKALRLTPVEDDEQAAGKIAEIASGYKDANAAVLVFVRTLKAVGVIERELIKTKRPVVLLTGTMRGLERDALVSKPNFRRFLNGSDSGETVYLVCTSAGEVGIDISADHMVCDLSTFDSMAQRFGRVNRYGTRTDTHIDVVHPRKFEDKDKLAPARKATLELLDKLGGDASPKNLGDQMRSLSEKQREDAFAPSPTIIPATDILFDAWSLTSIREKMPGRPPVEPYLHGIADWQPPETHIAWREEVELITGDLLAEHPPADLLEDYPLHPHELLRDVSMRVFSELQKLARTHAQMPAWVIDSTGQVKVSTLKAIADPDASSNEKKRLVDDIAMCTVLLAPTIGGLAGGLLDGHAADAERESLDVSDDTRDENDNPRRQRFFSVDPRADGPNGMALVRTIDTTPDAEDGNDDSGETDEVDASDSERLMPRLMRGRYWHWYALPRYTEDASRASTRPISWDHHTRDVVDRTAQIVSDLRLPDPIRQAINLAAELHDLGKKRVLWQRSIGNPNPTDWHAKPGKPDRGRRWKPQHITDYRHEFGSLLDAQADTRFIALSPDMQDLVLHLIASHHGRARPHFPLNEAFDPDTGPALTDPIATEVPRRFARLQRRYGRWGLAYIESLLRAADWAASAQPSTMLDAHDNEVKP